MYSHQSKTNATSSQKREQTDSWGKPITGPQGPVSVFKPKIENQTLEKNNPEKENATEPTQSNPFVLSESVGKGGVNFSNDVNLIQEKLLELNLISEETFQSECSHQIEISKIPESSIKQTIKAIYEYQKFMHYGSFSPDGNIGANGGTYKSMLTVTAETFEKAKTTYYRKKKEEKQRKEQERLAKIKAEKKKKEEIQRKRELKENYKDFIKNNELDDDINRTAQEMVKIIFDFPELMQQSFNSADYLDKDNIAFAILQQLLDEQLSNVEESILKDFKREMDEGWTTDEEYKSIERIGKVKKSEKELDFSDMELDVKQYWETQGKTPNCNIYTKKVIDKHKIAHPELYNNFGDINSSLTTKQHSLHLTWEKDWEKGASRTQGKKGANDTSTLYKDNEWEMAIKYIIACLDAGVPAMVGVNHTYGYAQANNDKTTDHWLTIIGKGNENGKNYFIYTDPGTSRKSTGTDSIKNRLVQSDENPHIWRDETKYANVDAGSGSYTLVAVTLYNKHRNKKEFKIGNQTFKRKI